MRRRARRAARVAGARPFRLRGACVPCALLLAACADRPKRVAVTPPPPETVYVTTPAPAPRPAPLPVTPARLDFVALNDTARLLVPTGAQCAVASDAVARMDSTGLVTSLANGDTHVRCWQGGQVATIPVRVQQQLSRVTIVADRALEMARPGDSLQLSLTQTDRMGTPVAAGPPTWQSLAPTVVAVSPAGVATGVADSGAARIVGAVQGIADTVTVRVGAKATLTRDLARTTGPTSRARVLAAMARQRDVAQRAAASGQIESQAYTAGGPSAAAAPAQAQIPGATIINARPPRLSDSLFNNPSTGLGLQRLLVPGAMGIFAERRSLDTLNGLTKHSGILFGGGLDITTRGLLSFRLAFATGTMTGDSTSTGLDRSLTVSQGSFDACLAIAPWLTLLGGGTARVYQTGSSTERWSSLEAGAEAAFNLGGGPLYGYARAMVMPTISVQNDVATISAPTFGLAAALGVGLESQRISTRLMYGIEHYSFSAATGRKEQFADLVFRLGYKFGW